MTHSVHEATKITTHYGMIPSELANALSTTTALSAGLISQGSSILLESGQKDFVLL